MAFGVAYPGGVAANARARFARGAFEEARAALKEVGDPPPGAWLGRALEVFLPLDDGPGAAARAPQALDELATRPQPQFVHGQVFPRTTDMSLF